MRTATVWIEDGVFALFFRPYQGAFGGSNVPAPGNLLNQGKNNANARGGGAGGRGGAYRGSIPFRASSLSWFSLKFLAEALSTQAYLPGLHPQNSKGNFTLKRSLMNRQLIKRINKLLNFPPFWEKVFLTPAVPLSYQKQC